MQRANFENAKKQMVNCTKVQHKEHMYAMTNFLYRVCPSMEKFGKHRKRGPASQMAAVSFQFQKL